MGPFGGLYPLPLRSLPSISIRSLSIWKHGSHSTTNRNLYSCALNRYTRGEIISMGKILLAALLFIATSAMAGDGHDKYHSEFYSTLKQPNGISCCNDRDCEPVKKHRWNRDVGWEFWYDNGWLMIPKDRIQFKVTPDGEAHLCSRRLGMNPRRHQLSSKQPPAKDNVTTGVYIICAIIPFKGF